MTIAERVLLGICAIVIAFSAAFMVGLMQAERRADCFHHPHETPCPKPTWLGERADELLAVFGRRL